MPNRYLKLKRNDIARLQFIFEGHEGLGTCTTIDKNKAVVKLFIMPDFVKRFLHKNVSITMIDGSTITGELTGFNNYELMINEKILIEKHAMMKVQEVEANP